MEKKFRDLKKGDSVFIIDNGEVVEAKVKNIRESWYGWFYVYTTHPKWPYCCGWSGSKRVGNLFIDEEAAYEQTKGDIREEEKHVGEKD